MKQFKLPVKFFIVFVILALYGCSSSISKDALVGKWEYTEAYVVSENGQAFGIDITGKYVEFSLDGSYCLSSNCGSYIISDNGKLEVSGVNILGGELSTSFSNVHELDAEISWGRLTLSAPDYLPGFTKLVIKLKKVNDY